MNEVLLTSCSALLVINGALIALAVMAKKAAMALEQKVLEAQGDLGKATKQLVDVHNGFARELQGLRDKIQSVDLRTAGITQKRFG